MNPNKAIAILAVPFALTTLGLLSAMCLTPYWKCSIDLSASIPNLSKSLLFVFAVFVVLAVVLLYVDWVAINFLSRREKGSLFLVVLIGAALAVAPRIVLAVAGGVGIWALLPRWEHLPLAISGAVFAGLLHWLVRPKDRPNPV